MISGYQIAYAAAFAQAFNHWMQTRGLLPPGYTDLSQSIGASEQDIAAARAYARHQATLAAEQWADDS